MIVITNIRNLKPNMYDETYAIVRSLKSSSPWLKQVSVLSPSPSLFHKYMMLKNMGQWSAESFRTIYVPQFIYEMRYSQAAANALNTIVQMHREGKRIAMACFCPDETLCHRSIIAGLLQGHGEEVITDTGNDYSLYYKQYLEA